MSRAAELYEQAAALGHHGAQTHLGLLLADAGGSNLTASARWLQLAAKGGDVLGQKSLAFAFANGQGVQQNLTRAARWMTRAAEQDDLEAAYVLGTMYLHGQGVEASRARAKRWLRQSAEAGYVDAQKEMALFEKGEGVPGKQGPGTLNPKPYTLNPKPDTLNPKPDTLNPKP